MPLESHGKSPGMAGTRSSNNVVRTQLPSCLLLSFVLASLSGRLSLLGCPRSSSLGLPHSGQSCWKESPSLPLVPMNVLELALLSLIPLPVMEAIPVEDGSEISIPSHESGDRGVYGSILTTGTRVRER